MKRDYSQPVSRALLGKTIVALHRAVFLARANADSRVLLTTFSETLANALRTKLRRLISNEPRLGERLEVHAMDAIGERLYEQHFGHPKIASPEVRRRFVTDAATAVPDLKFSLSFLLTEWEELVDAWQLQTWESYRDIKRGQKDAFARIPTRYAMGSARRSARPFACRRVCHPCRNLHPLGGSVGEPQTSAV